MYTLQNIEERKLGKYKLPFKNFDEETEEREVNVVYVSGEGSRLWAIIIETEDGGYQDYYWNDNEERFKPLTYNYGDEYDDLTFRESWMEECVGDKLPKEFRNYIPKPLND